MDKLLIVANFHVDVSTAVEGKTAREEFTKGQVIEASDVPAGHTAQEWIDKELAKAA